MSRSAMATGPKCQHAALATTGPSLTTNRGGRPAKNYARFMQHRTKGYFYGKRPRDPNNPKAGSESKSFGFARAKAERRYDYWKRYKAYPGDIAIVPLLQASDAQGTRPARTQRLLQFFASMVADDINEATCLAYAKWCKLLPCRTGELADGTIRGDLKHLHAVVGAACAEIDTTYVFSVHLPPEGGPRESYFYADWMARFIRAARGRVRDPDAEDGWLRGKDGRLILTTDPERLLAGRMLARFVMLALYTGSRRAVVEEARWARGEKHGHFDRLDHVFYRKGRGQSQTNKRAPPVALTPFLCRLLDGWYRRDRRQWRARRLAEAFTEQLAEIVGLAANEELVVDIDDDLLVDFDRELGPGFDQELVIHNGQGKPFQLDWWWGVILSEAGLDNDLVPHSLRRTIAIWLIAAGVSDDLVADFLALDLANLAKHYLVASVELTDPIADALDAFVLGCSPNEVSMADHRTILRNRRLHDLIATQLQREGG